jgi:hypothetical protein
VTSGLRRLRKIRASSIPAATKRQSGFLLRLRDRLGKTLLGRRAVGESAAANGRVYCQEEWRQAMRRTDLDNGGMFLIHVVSMSSLLYLVFAPPTGRTMAEGLSEQSAQMCLIRESNAQRDFAQRS